MDITKQQPKYWGSWKGRVIAAIALNGEQTWTELIEKTGLSKKALNRALSELYNDKAVVKTGRNRYRVSPELYKEYKEFLPADQPPGKKARAKKWRERFDKNRKMVYVKWIEDWRSLRKLDFSLDSKHFFLEGKHLTPISEELIRQAKSEVLVINPFVDCCNISDSLRDAKRNGVIVKLITRPPKQEDRFQYHQILKTDRIDLTYNSKVHAKLIVIDRIIAIISSMNFYSSSLAGRDWEAGIISIEDEVVQKVTDSILTLLEKPESQLQE